MGFTPEDATGLINVYSQQAGHFHSAADKAPTIICPSSQSSRIVHRLATHARCVSFAAFYQAIQVPEKPQQCLPAIVRQEGPAKLSRLRACNFPPLALGCFVFTQPEQ